jgi:hypothetical protein
MRNPPFKSKEELENAYTKLVTEVTRDYYKDQNQKLADLGRSVGATGFDLIPAGFWRWPAPAGSGDTWQGLRNIGPHLFGILLFAGLLTLGAPYWYIILKNLASLRPALAQLIDSEKKRPNAFCMKESSPVASAISGGATVETGLIGRIKKWGFFPRREPSAPARFAPAAIGDSRQGVVRVIAFTAGGADNVFQFGMVHAFLVSDAPKPHVVAGTSCGAVVAAMLADVLQAGESHPKDQTARRLAQTPRFRAFLGQIEHAPTDLAEASFPDFTEVSAYRHCGRSQKLTLRMQPPLCHFCEVD